MSGITLREALPLSARRVALPVAVLMVVACTSGGATTGGSRDVAAAGAGLAFGGVRVVGWNRAILDTSPTNLDVRQRRTGAAFTIRGDAGGNFAIPLPAGPYALTGIWSGLHRVDVPRDTLRFAVPPDMAVYLGTLEIRAPTDRTPGGASVLDEVEAATRRLRAVGPRPLAAAPVAKGLLFHAPPRGVVVSVLLDERLLVPFLVDTGATYTTITRAVSRALGITDVAHLPRRPFHGLGGVVELPVTVLASMRVDEAQATGVDVAIDVNDRLPVGLLGSTFLRHFRVTIDQEQGDVRLDR